MIEQLRELAEAEPFQPFSVRLQTGEEYEIETKKAIELTHYGSPKIRDSQRWHILNSEALLQYGIQLRFERNQDGSVSGYTVGDS